MRFYALLCAFTQFTVLSSLLRLQFTPFTVQGYIVFKFYPLSLKYRNPAASLLNARHLSLRYRNPAASPLNARHYMFENHAIKLINRQLS